MINLTVKKAPGADDVSLGNTTIQYVDDDQIVNLVHDSQTDRAGTDGFFYTNATIDVATPLRTVTSSTSRTTVRSSR